MIKNYLLNFRKILLEKNEKVSELEMTSGNYDNGELIKQKIPTITTEFCEIGIYKRIIYFVFIIYSDTYSKKIFDLLKNFPDIRFYGFKNFKKNLYPKKDFDYKIFKKEIKKDKYLQIQFNYNISKISLELLYKEYFKIKDILIKNNAKVINQIIENL